MLSIWRMPDSASAASAARPFSVSLSGSFSLSWRALMTAATKSSVMAYAMAMPWKRRSQSRPSHAASQA